MLSTSVSNRWIIRAGLVLAGAASFVVACVTDEHPRPKCNELADGGVPVAVPDGSQYEVVPTTDAQPPTALGVDPDPGPVCTDCTQDSAVEVMLVHDFEQGFAPTWFNYGEPGIPIQPQQVGPGTTAEGVAKTVPVPYWGLQVPDLGTLPGGRRCGSRYALHLSGGRFLSWGGGYVSQFVTVRGPEYVEKYCPQDAPKEEEDRRALWGIGAQPMASGDTCGFWITPVPTQGSLRGINVSEFEGVSFWARRGPGGQSTLRIAMNDENTSEGLALEVELANYEARQADPNAPLEQPACERVKSCCRQCNQLPRDALAYDEGGNVTGIRAVTEARCHAPGGKLPPRMRVNDEGGIEYCSPKERVSSSGGYPEECGLDVPKPAEDAGVPPGPSWRAYDATTYKNDFDEWERDIKLCCPPTKEQEAADPVRFEGQGDPKYGGSECNPYVFMFDQSNAGNYCWQPGDPPLPEKNQNRCGDAFEANVSVDTEWRFFKIPWSELRRFTPNRPPIDTTGIWSIALFFSSGYLDTYVDDIGFYRKRR